VSWTSADPAVATVDEDGLVTAQAVGETLVSATIEGLTEEARVQVQPRPITAWRDHSCAVTDAGRVLCWGRGVNGQVGNGAHEIVTEPTAVEFPSAATWTAVATGAGHSCALDDAGGVACWGRGHEGQLGHGANDGSATPVQVDFALQFRSITVGERHSCGLTARDARTWCWGWNAFGQLGTGDRVTVNTPVEVVGGPEFTQVAAGARHSCGLSAAGEVWCWGDNSAGQLGDGTFQDRPSPTRVSSGAAFRFVAAGVRHSCAIDTGGGLHCWGDNPSGQLGTGDLTSSPTPRAADSDADFVSVSLGAEHSCGIADDQRALCWGLANAGRLGIGAFPFLVASPVQVAGGAVYTHVLTGREHGCAITFAFTLKCWGSGALGQLGHGNRESSSVPVDPASLVFVIRFDG